MPKIFSFFLSAAIIILCLWLNVHFYPNIVRQGSVKAADEAQGTESTETTKNLLPLDEQSVEKARQELQKPEKDDAPSPDVKNAPINGEKDAKEPISASVENNLLNVSVASNQKFSSSGKDEKTSDSVVPETTLNAQANADKPQGGKYVSIPSVEVDAFRSRYGSNSGRVIGVSNASALAN